MPFDLALLNRRRRFGGGFSPASLFAAGEPGAWYDPSDFSTLFQDSAGTTPVTAVAQQVGLMLDKSQGLVLGPELVTNGDFSSGTGWNAGGTGVSISGGKLNFAASTDNSGVFQTNAAYASAYIEITVVIDSVSSGAVTVTVGIGNPGPGNTVLYTLPGTYTRRVLNTGDNFLRVYSDGASTTAVVDSVSVRAVAGNHAFQSNSGQRPTLGRNPTTGRLNLLTFTEEFDNAAWTKTNVTVTANSAVAPDGTTTAEKIIATAANVNHFVEAIITMGASPHTASAYFKAAEYTTASIFLTQSGNNGAVFNLSNGTVSSVTGTGNTASITDAGNGWYRCVLTNNGSADLFDAVRFGPSNGAVASFAGNGIDGVFVWGAQLQTGTIATAYQRVVSSFDVTEAGKPDLYYVNFDGTDDGMLTNTITPGIDKAQIFAGARKISDAAEACLVETSIATSAINGSVGIFAPGTTSGSPTGKYFFASRGTIRAVVEPTGYSAPVTNILTGIGDIAGDVATLRVNGVLAGTSTADQGTGNYTAQPLYLGRRAGTTFPFNGNMYSMIVRFGANLTADQIAATEAWVNTKTAALPVDYYYLQTATGDQLVDGNGDELYSLPIFG